MGHFTDVILLVIGGLFALVGLAKLGTMLGGKSAPWLGIVFVLLGLASTPLLLGWMLDRFGVVERAVVADRRESVTLEVNGGWRTQYWVTVKYPSAPAGLHRLRADPVAYDRLAFGDPVEVRVLPIRRSVARLEMTSSSAWLRQFPAFTRWLVALGPLAVVVGLLVFGGKGASGKVRRVVGLGLVALGGFSCHQDFKPFDGLPGPSGPTERAGGTVKRMWTVRALYPATASEDRAWQLATPYRLVAAEFTPVGSRSAVMMVDAVDEESVPSLAVGDQIRVVYSRAEPRRARLDAGKRTFPAANAGDRRIAAGIGAGLLLVLVALRMMLAPKRR
jgi:hypothetical protein